MAEQRCSRCGTPHDAAQQNLHFCARCGTPLAWQGDAANVGFTPGPNGPMPVQPSPEAQNLGYWALGLGLASVTICPLCGPFALWMGMRASRAGAGGMGIAGTILGGIATLGMFMLLMFWGGLGLFLLALAQHIPSMGGAPGGVPPPPVPLPPGPPGSWLPWWPGM
jgi:hypothetical protein